MTRPKQRGVTEEVRTCMGCGGTGKNQSFKLPGTFDTCERCAGCGRVVVKLVDPRDERSPDAEDWKRRDHALDKASFEADTAAPGTKIGP